MDALHEQSNLTWYLEADMAHMLPFWSNLPSSSQSAIIKDIVARVLANQDMWPSITAFVVNYIETVNSMEFHPEITHQWEYWGMCLNLLNLG